MRLPNLFILGAIRCGTSSMRTYLAEHPRIFMARNEPRFFSNDLRSNWAPNPTEREYFDMFRCASRSHAVIGDSSPIYLYSENAVRNIVDFCPNAKFVVMLRPPIDMARSLHQRLLFEAFEDEPDFEAAWRLQPTRRSGRSIPSLAFEPRLLQYGAVCAPGSQLRRLYDQVARERVHLVFHDEMQADTRRVYEGVLRFLGLESDGRKSFSVRNPNTRRRIQWIQKAIVLIGKAKVHFDWNVNLGIAGRLDRLNRVALRRDPLRVSFARELETFFSHEIDLLSEWTGRDLGHWNLSSGSSPFEAA